MSKILLIDDTKFARKLLRNILEEHGYTVCGEAADGEQGVKLFMEKKPELVFCDLMMKGMDGVDCTKAIMALDPKANIVICTSVHTEQYLINAKKAGAKELLIKPVTVDQVLQVTKRFIGRADKDTKIVYKDLMEERADKCNIPPKQLLDFFAAFLQLTGLKFDAPEVDEKYLKEKTAGIVIGMRALLAAKMSTSDVNRLVNIFEELTS